MDDARIPDHVDIAIVGGGPVGAAVGGAAGAAVGQAQKPD